MKKQLMSAILCATAFVPGAQAMLGGRTLSDVQPTSFRRVDVANKVAERREIGSRATNLRQASAVNQPTALNKTTVVQRPALNTGHAGMARPATAPLTTMQTQTVVPATVPARKASFSDVQQGYSSVSSAPAFSSVMPASGSARISEGMSSASTFQGLKQTTGRTAPSAVQNVMQTAPAQRAKSFFQ